MAYLSAATNQPMSKERADVYYDMLQEMPLETLRIAAKKVALSHSWSTFPSVAEIHEAACETVMSQCQELLPMQAWAIARRAAASIDPDVQGPYFRNGKEHRSMAAAFMADVPLLVAKAIRQIGLNAIGKDNESVVRAHFTRAYEAIVNDHKKLALMPPSLKREIEAQQPDVLKRIGVER
jgi:hypothetical protein